MPEIVEVKRFVDFINSKIHNKYILDIIIHKGRYKKHKPFTNYDILKKMCPIKVIEVKSKGKLIYIILENNLFILNSLGLFGGWLYYSFAKDKYQFEQMRYYVDKERLESYYTNVINHLNIEFIYTDSKKNKNSLFFYDMLSFGSMKVITSIDELNKKLSIIGPDIMDLETTFDIFINRIRKYNDKKIGIVLMNQKCISGIGNYLRADILWLSKINPFKNVKNITDDELKKIYYNSRLLTYGEYDRDKAIILNIIKKRDKIPSDYERDFFIYDQKEDIYGNEVTKELLYEGSQKRYIYFVKELQK